MNSVKGTEITMNYENISGKYSPIKFEKKIQYLTRKIINVINHRHELR